MDWTYFVSECGEFHGAGTFFKDIPNIQKAIKTFMMVREKSLLNGVPSIGITFDDWEYDILTGKNLNLDYIPAEVKDNKKFMQDMIVLSEYVNNQVA